MTERYYIATPISPGNFAGTKARRDIEALAARRGMRPIVFQGEPDANRNLFERIRLVWHGLANWARLERTLPKGALVEIDAVVAL